MTQIKGIKSFGRKPKFSPVYFNWIPLLLFITPIIKKLGKLWFSSETFYVFFYLSNALGHSCILMLQSHLMIYGRRPRMLSFSIIQPI